MGWDDDDDDDDDDLDDDLDEDPEDDDDLDDDPDEAGGDEDHDLWDEVVGEDRHLGISDIAIGHEIADEILGGDEDDRPARSEPMGYGRQTPFRMEPAPGFGYAPVPAGGQGGCGCGGCGCLLMIFLVIGLLSSLKGC